MVTHFFALLPISISYYYGETLICIFIVISTLVSLVYHSDESNRELHYSDHFFSNALIILTFILYLDHAYKLATVLMALLAVFVIVEYNNDVNIIPFFVGFVCACAVVMFFYEKVVVKNSSSRFNYRNAYFLSFFVTQIIAVGFFVWDEDPYAHSFWHLFAFTSLASVLAHVCSLDCESEKTTENRHIDRILFYWLGSLPSRFYISAVLLHWGSTTNMKALPLAITFLFLASSMVVQRKSPHAKMKATSYSIIAGVLFFGDQISLAGGILLADTILSAAGWFARKKTVEKIKYEPVKKVEQMELKNLVF